jgi:hypothetical protein
MSLTARAWAGPVLAAGFLGLVAPVLFGLPVLAWILYAALLLATFLPAILARRLSGRETGGSAERLAFDLATGLGVYALACSLTGALLSLAIAPFAGLAASNLAVFLLPSEKTGEDPNPGQFPWAAFLATILFVTLFLMPFFRNYGVPRDGMVGYPKLAVSDLFNHISVTGELAKEIPPKNPYFTGETLHYYWLSHVLPSSLYRLSGLRLSLHDLLLTAGYLNGAAFVFLLTIFLRRRFGAGRAVWIGLFLAFVAYSYADILVLFQETASRVPPSWRETLFLDRILVEEGESYSGMAHAWHRDFAVEPHATLALVLGLAFLLRLNVWRERRPALYESAVAGVLLGAAVGCDAFVGLTFAFAGFSILGFRCLKMGRDRGGYWLSLGTMGGTFVLVNLLYAVWEMHGGGSSFVHLSVYLRMLLLSPFALAIELGPTLVFGVVGLVLLFRRRDRGRDVDLVLVLLVSLFFMFFVQHDLSPNLFMRKSLKVIRLPLLVFALAWLVPLTAGKGPRKSFGAAMILLALSLPTVLTDIPRLSRSDSGEGLCLVDGWDLRAYGWVKENAPRETVMQGFPDYSTPSLYTPATVFGDRRTALGDWMKAVIYQVGRERVNERSRIVKKILFGETSLEETLEVVRDLEIDWIYVGPTERTMLGESTRKFEAWPDRFEPVYQKGPVTIYRVRHEPSGD